MSTDRPENEPGPREPGEPPPPGPHGPSGTPPGQPPPPGGGSPYDTPPGQPPPSGGYGPPPGSPYGDPYGSPYGTAGGAPDETAGLPPLASRGKRLLARIVDALIIGIPVGLLTGLVSGFDYDDGGSQYWQGGFYTLAYFVYEGLLLSRSGQTVGKKLMRVRVAMLRDGAVPAGTPAWLRAVVYQLPALVPCIGSLFWLVNVLFCVWDKPYQQCLHDKAVRTVVVAAD